MPLDSSVRHHAEPERPGVGTVDRVGVASACDASEAFVVGS